MFSDRRQIPHILGSNSFGWKRIPPELIDDCCLKLYSLSCLLWWRPGTIIINIIIMLPWRLFWRRENNVTRNDAVFLIITEKSGSHSTKEMYASDTEFRLIRRKCQLFKTKHLKLI